MRDKCDREGSVLLLREGSPARHDLSLVCYKAIPAAALDDKDGLRVYGH